MNQCLCCSIAFEPYRNNPDQKFCSLECYNQFRREQSEFYRKTSVNEYKCLNCDNGFEPNIINRNMHFCSDACYKDFRRKNPMLFNERTGEWLPCEWCGKSVYRQPSTRQKHTYCSRTCSNQAQSKLLHEHPELRTAKGVALKCQNCGHEYYVKPNRAAQSKFCSRACHNSYRFGRPRASYVHRDTTGDKNPNYRGTANKTTGRQTAFRSFPKVCMICGFDVVVTVHHIIPRRLGGTNELENLVVLCPNHHAMADKGLISVDELKLIVRAAIARKSGPQLRSDQQ
jgi:HNH endonuclease